MPVSSGRGKHRRSHRICEGLGLSASEIACATACRFWAARLLPARPERLVTLSDRSGRRSSSTGPCRPSRTAGCLRWTPSHTYPFGYMKLDSMDAVFRALAHPDRRRMLDIVRAEPGAAVGEVCDHFDMSRIGAMKHLRVLEEAELVLSRKEGRTRRLYVNAAPIQMIHDRWLSDWSALWATQVTQVKYRVEALAANASAGHDTPTDTNAVRTAS